MYAAFLSLHLIVCLALVSVVLVQSGKGGGLSGGAFGGATQTVFGGRGATDFVTRATIGLGIAFFITSVALALMTTKGGTGAHKSLLQEQARKASSATPSQTQPAPGSVPASPSTPTTTPSPLPAAGAH